jgi:hypothetical protein
VDLASHILVTSNSIQGGGVNIIYPLICYKTVTLIKLFNTDQSFFLKAEVFTSKSVKK